MEKYIKSPLNYTGGKYQVLSQILPHFPEDIDTFVDLFCGGCNVVINAAAGRFICNDIDKKVVELFSFFKFTNIDEVLEQMDARIKKYKLSRFEVDGYYDLRRDYNENQNPLDLYILICFGFNNQIRFNSKGEYNIPFGQRCFNGKMRDNLTKLVNRIQEMEVEFISQDFRDIPMDSFAPEDFVYCDPPYLITCATYNERGGWNREVESDLFDYLDGLSSRGIRFALSNVFEHKGRKNEPLIVWADKYNVIPIERDYSRASYNTRRGGSKEVLITNY